MRIRAAEPYQASRGLPWSFAAIFAGHGPAKRLGLTAPLLVTLALGTGACNDGYSAAPTFCDQWCAALRHPSDCAQAPASCVRDCELTKASSDCFPLQERLLSCYEQLEPEAFTCAPPSSQSSFSDRLRVDKEACRTERDALFECEAPGFGECLGLCRGYQLILTEGAFGELGGAPGDDCPLLTQPCETICWTAFAFTSEDLERLRLPAPQAALDEISSDARTGPGDAGSDASAGSANPLTLLFAPCFDSSAAVETPR